MNKRAFTLIELLVTIAIIGLGMVLLTPALGKAREGARKAQCANNSRQIGMAWQMYIDDNGAFPRQVLVPELFSLKWYALLLRYTDNEETIYRCPSHLPWRSSWLSSTPAADGYQFDYVVRLEVLGTSGAICPSNRTIVACKVEGAAPYTHYYFSGWSQLFSGHSGGANLLYWDGHTEWHKKETGMTTEYLN